MTTGGWAAIFGLVFIGIPYFIYVWWDLHRHEYLWCPECGRLTRTEMGRSERIQWALNRRAQSNHHRVCAECLKADRR